MKFNLLKYIDIHIITNQIAIYSIYKIEIHIFGKCLLNEKEKYNNHYLCDCGEYYIHISVHQLKCLKKSER